MATDVLYCARHPSVETGLRCGRCETPICPKCAVFTDVGARCPACAPAKKLPQFELGPLYFARGTAAAALSGAAIGLAWGIVLPGGFGFFMIFLGLGIGYGVAESVSWSTNRKSGPIVQTLAALGVLLAYLVRNLVAGYGIVAFDDISGLIALAAGIIVAVNRLRY